ncbi:protein of unknown function [Modestobacter italicus]|uniref:Uncharacterized protein n=1 Tax=Modestobacter italicus (strain DSM 44449 / CECT 9708 / BC 501) TaxID=2732864 RepID=I4EYL1_MODI5|nr:protein of unknown function [Modestobacter marinus]
MNETLFATSPSEYPTTRLRGSLSSALVRVESLTMTDSFSTGLSSGALGRV